MWLLENWFGLVCHDWIMKMYNGSLLVLENDCLFLNISFHCLGVNRTIKFFLLGIVFM